MNFIDGLIECSAFFIDRNFDKIEVVIARLEVRSRINDNLSLVINGNLRRRLASVCVERAILIPEWLALRTSGLTQQFELVAMARETLCFAVLHEDLISFDFDCRIHVQGSNFTNDKVAVGHDAATVGVGVVTADDGRSRCLCINFSLVGRMSLKAKHVLSLGTAVGIDGYLLTIACALPASRATAEHLAKNDRNRILAVVLAYQEEILMTLFFEG